ncbi:E3 ubiquitin-protein ligase [Dirofilaria immitis]
MCINEVFSSFRHAEIAYQQLSRFVSISWVYSCDLLIMINGFFVYYYILIWKNSDFVLPVDEIFVLLFFQSENVTILNVSERTKEVQL